jgi:GT2 family glycosyltransferase
MPQNAVSIIIPNFNGEGLLVKNLPQVVKAALVYEGPCEVIVVDDASKDGSVNFVRTYFPLVKLVCNDTNRGFADSVHVGIRHALHDQIILLNSDVRPDLDFIAPLMRHFRDPKTFAVSPLICDPDGNPQAVSWNLGMIRRGTIKFRPWDLGEARDRVNSGQQLKSLFASGGSVALCKTKFLQLGGFLSLFKPFYYEDVELCTRAWLNGWQTLFDPRSRIVHDHVGTIKRYFDARRVRIVRLRNRFFYLWLYLSFNAIVVSHIPGIVSRSFLSALQLDGRYLKALFLACIQMKKVAAFRTQIQLSASNFNPLETLLLEMEKNQSL